MTEQDGDSFLGRWSRRKQAARRGEALPEPAAPAPDADPAHAVEAGPAVPGTPPELPAVDTLEGLASDYRAFMNPEVDAATRSAALRRLFSDPHFNAMDGLDVYIDDYSIADPIPPAMLRALNQARALGLFDGEEKQPEGSPPVAVAAPPAASETPAPTAPAAPPDKPAEA